MPYLQLIKNILPLQTPEIKRGLKFEKISPPSEHFTKILKRVTNTKMPLRLKRFRDLALRYQSVVCRLTIKID